MVKTTNSNIKSSGLDAVVEQLKINNKQSVQQTSAINELISDNQAARIQEKRTLAAERAVEQRKESLDKKSKLEALRERKPSGIAGSFTRGAIGGTAYGALGAGLGGLGMGAGLGGLLRGAAGLAGKGLLFGGLVAATNSMIQGVLDRTFDKIKPEDMGFADEERAREKITGGMNAAIALKFLGVRGRTSLLAGIGLAFSDQITTFISNRLGTDRLTAPDWMQKTFGLTEDQMTINLKDGKVSAAIGAAISLLAGQIAMIAATRAGRGIKNFILPPKVSLDNKRGFDPKLQAPKVTTKLNTPKLSNLANAIDDPPKLANFQSQLLQLQKSGQTLGGGLFMPEGATRPLIPSEVVPGKKVFATNAQIQKALNESAQEMADAKKRILTAEKRFSTNSSTSRIGSLANAAKGPLSKTLSFGLKASGPLSTAYTGVLGVLDTERIAAGQGSTFRTFSGIGEGATGLLDFIVNGTYGLAMKGVNLGFEKAGSEFRVKDTFDYTGAFRSSSFVLHDAMRQGFADYLSVNEQEIKDLTLGGSNLQGNNLLITNDQITGDTNIGTNNFSMNNNSLGFVDPYAIFK